MLKLSVLDQSPVKSGHTVEEALAETVALAQAAEAAGYHRYWVAEHHGTATFAGPAPEIMVTRIAAATDHIRVGSGGVMLSHYSPYKVAEMFRVLEALFPGRIDLGIGRAPGSDGITAAALAYGNQIGIEYFPTKIGDLMAFLTDSPPPTEAFARVTATPHAAGVPELWLLGSSDQSAYLAAHFGLGYSYAQFITEHYKDSALKAYRETFKPSEFLAEPRVSVSIFVVCAETEREADRLAMSRDYWNIMRERNRRGPFPSVEEAEAAAKEYSDIDRAIIAESRKRLVCGTPAHCKERLTEIAADYGAEEVVVLTITHDAAARIRSYELLADAFGIARRDAAA